MQHIASLAGVSKTFGQTVALRDVDFTLNAGEIHGVVGENGAGKSTLMRILAGQVRSDSGRLRFEDHDVDLTVEAEGFRDGIGFVEQEGGLIAELTGSENLLLTGQGLVAHRGRATRKLAELAARFGGSIDARLPVQQLAVGQRQRLEILIVMARGARVLILDEPTASLGTDEALALTEIIRKFVAEGGAVVYISHKLHEVIDLADRITVMRRGAVVASHVAAAVSVDQLATEMVGEVATSRGNDEDAEGLVELAMGLRTDTDTPTGSEIVASMRSVVAAAPLPGEAPLRGVDLDVHAGEVLGVAGVVGSGQTTLAEVLAGLTTPTTGTVALSGGRPGYVPENRHRDGIALYLSIKDNLLVQNHGCDAFARGLWFREDHVRRHVSALLDDSNVRHGGVDQPICTVSGGNQQKAVVARELEDRPRLVVAHNPFRGLDVRAIQDVREAMLRAAHDGAGLVLLSPDLDELHQLADRIVVMFDGRVVGEVRVNDADSTRLGQLMGGLA